MFTTDSINTLYCNFTSKVINEQLNQGFDIDDCEASKAIINKLIDYTLFINIHLKNQNCILDSNIVNKIKKLINTPTGVKLNNCNNCE